MSYPSRGVGYDSGPAVASRVVTRGQARKICVAPPKSGTADTRRAGSRVARNLLRSLANLGRLQAGTVTNPSAREWPASVLVGTRLLSLAVVIAALYWGQAVLVPLVLAALLTFLLSPLVTRLDRLRVPRVVGVLLVMALVGGLIGGIGYVVAGQVQSFATELPTYRQNIRTKIRQAFAFTRGGAIESVQDTIDDISDVVDEESGEPAPTAREQRRNDEPLRVSIEQVAAAARQRRMARSIVRRRRHRRAHAAARDLHAHQSRGLAR